MGERTDKGKWKGGRGCCACWGFCYCVERFAGFVSTGLDVAGGLGRTERVTSGERRYEKLGGSGE
jgi:hypothetical protein